MEEAEVVSLVETKCTWIVVSIHHQKTTTSLVVLMAKPILDELHQLTANVLSLELNVHTDTSDECSWITSSTFGIINRTIQAVTGRFIQMQSLDAVIGQCKECNNAMRFLLRHLTISLAHQFICISLSIVMEEVVKVCVATTKR